MSTLPSVASGALRLQRRSLIVWVIAVIALVGVYVAVYPSVRDSPSMAKVIDEMPKAYKALFSAGGNLDFTSPAGYLNTELLTFMGPLVVLIYAIGFGAGAVAGEEDRRTLELILVTRVTRTRLVIEKFAALAGSVMILMTALWLAVVVEGTAVGMAVPVATSAAAFLHLGLLGVEFGTLALLVGAARGHLALSRGVAALLGVLAYLVNGLAPLVGWLAPAHKFSPFYQYIGHNPLQHGVSIAALVVTTASIAGLLALSVVAFNRRDVLA